jgi:RimJ/RimL family protein N-acetyltransferase
MNPLLLDIPAELQTTRLLLRTPRSGDGPVVYASVRESLAELKPWMPWATDDYNEQASEEWCRKSAGLFHTRETLQFLMFHRESGVHLGNIGAFAFKWEIPKCEIGYWLRTPQTHQGYMTEATAALTEFCHEKLGTLRIEIRCDDRNQSSAGVAERCRYTLEGVFHNESRDPAGQLRHTRIYARTRPA